MIKKLEGKDAFDVFTLFNNSSYANYLSHTIYGQPKVFKFIEKSINDDNQIWLGFFDGVKLVGVINYYKYLIKHLFLNHICVSDTHLKRGIGRALISEFINDASDFMLTPMLKVDSRNQQAISWYKKMGFAQHERERSLLIEFTNSNTLDWVLPLVNDRIQFTEYGFSFAKLNKIELGVIEGGLVSIKQGDLNKIFGKLLEAKPKRILVTDYDGSIFSDCINREDCKLLDFSVFCLLKK